MLTALLGLSARAGPILVGLDMRRSVACMVLRATVGATSRAAMSQPNPGAGGGTQQIVCCREQRDRRGTDDADYLLIIKLPARGSERVNTERASRRQPFFFLAGKVTWRLLFFCFFFLQKRKKICIHCKQSGNQAEGERKHEEYLGGASIVDSCNVDAAPTPTTFETNTTRLLHHREATSDQGGHRVGRQLWHRCAPPPHMAASSSIPLALTTPAAHHPPLLSNNTQAKRWPPG
jgi:hypothetical protein